MTYQGPTIPVHWRPIPAGAVNNPDGVLLPGNLIVVWHENGNPGATAAGEASFLLGGGGKDRVSYTFAVDHNEAYQFFTCNELCWHAADGCDNPVTDRGCFRGIPIEHCQNHDPVKWAATKRNGAILTAMIIGGHPSIHFGGREGDFSADRIETHRAVSDTKKWCPEFMLNEGSVPDQIALVESFLAIGQDDEPTKPTEPTGPTYADRITTGFTGKDTTVKRKVTIKTGEKDANGKALTEDIVVTYDVFELVRPFEVTQRTKRRQGPGSRDPQVGEMLEVRETFESRYAAVPRKQDGKAIPKSVFVVTDIGTWIVAEHLTPRFSIRKA